MRLTDQEFRAMNSAPRRFFQRRVEFPLFKSMGLSSECGDILEIGCGSGYGATLLAALQPRSYVGIDLMPEQVALAEKRRLPYAEFMIRDATDLGCFLGETKDVAVIFGILHHVVEWRAVIRECHRVLRYGGMLFLEEPDARLMAAVQRLSPGSHPKEAYFRLQLLEEALEDVGFAIRAKRSVLGFGFYCALKHTASEVGEAAA
jgi:SAM-dependent methyltransferase